jgi:hypothetical protein
MVCSFSNQEQWLRVQIPKEAWYAINVPIEANCSLTNALDPKEVIRFFAVSSFESDGGSAGILFQIPAFGYKIFELKVQG